MFRPENDTLTGMNLTRTSASRMKLIIQIDSSINLTLPRSTDYEQVMFRYFVEISDLYP